MVDSRTRSKWKLDPREYNGGQLSTSFSFSSLPESYKSILSDKNSSKNPVINLDWLEFFGEGYVPLPVSKPKMKPEDYIHRLAENVHLVYQGHGTSFFNAAFEIHMGAEILGTIFAHPRSKKQGLKETSFQMKISNYLLYTDYWLDLLNHFLFLLDLQIKSVTRCDIAIDGVDSIDQMLNLYYKQDQSQKYINMHGKAKFTPHQIHAKTMTAKSFQVGSSKSEKIVSVYCKSDEIENSNKNYITKFWENSGLKADGQKVHRIEMRFKSKYLRLITDFDYEKLIDKKYLASLVKTGCKGFFEFSWNNNVRLDRQKKIDLIPWDRLGGNLLQKNMKPETTDRYKAKLTIHLFEKLLICNKVTDPAKAAVMRDQITDLVIFYDLEKWYSEKLDHWHEAYKHMRAKNPLK